MYTKSLQQGQGSQASQRSYRDIKQRQNGIQQLINSSSNSSFIQQSVVHTRNNSSSTSNLQVNNLNQSVNQNSIHQISQKQQPNTSMTQRRDYSLNHQPSKQELLSGVQQQSRSDNVQLQQKINSTSDRHQQYQVIKRNISTEQINPHIKQIMDANKIPHMEKQGSHQRINSEADTEYNKENSSFYLNSIQSNQQRSYNYETSFNSKVIHPEKNYFMPLKQKQASNRRTTNMSTDFSNNNNSLRNNTNSQNNSSGYNANINSNNSIQNNLNKKNNGSSRLLTNLLNDSSANDNIIENYIERVFSKDLQSHTTSQQGYETNQRLQSKEDDLSFTQFNAYSENTQPQQSANQSNFNTEQSLKDQRIQSHMQIQKQIQSQSIYEQALQQKLKLLPGGKENKNSSSLTQIPRPLNKSQECQGGSNQIPQRNLNKYLFGDESNSNKRKSSQSNHNSSSYEESPQRTNNSTQKAQQLQKNVNNKDCQINPFTIVQKEKEECGVPASMYESELSRDNNKFLYNSSNVYSKQNQQSNSQNQQFYISTIQNLEIKIQDLEQKSQQLELTLIQKVKQIEQMGNQMHEYEKDKKEVVQSIEEYQKKQNNDSKQIQEAQVCIQSLSTVNQKQQNKLKEQNDQIQLLNMQIFEMEQQIYDINSNAKERERTQAKEKSDQILQLKQKFENEVLQLNDQHNQLIQLQNISLKQNEILQSEKLELQTKLLSTEELIENLQSQITHLKEQQGNIKQQSPIKSDQIAFLEQQLQDSEQELKDYKKKFSTVIINMSMVLDLIQKKIQSYQTSVKIADKSFNIQNLSKYLWKLFPSQNISFYNLGDQLMNQVSFGINQMALCIQPIIEEMKYLSQDSSINTFRQPLSKRSQSVGETRTEPSSQIPPLFNIQRQNSHKELKHLSNNISQSRNEGVNKNAPQMDLKNVQTASFGDQIPPSKQDQIDIQQKSQQRIIKQPDNLGNQNTSFNTNEMKYDSSLKQDQQHQQYNSNQATKNEISIPLSETSIEIQNIKNRIQQRQQRRKQNDSSYNSNNSFSYNSNQSNNYFTVGRENNSYSGQNHSFSCDNQQQQN